MTINKPEVVAIKDSDVGGLVELKPVLRLPHGTRLIRLSDYERLQAECEKLVEALETLLSVRVIEADAGYGMACAKAEEALAIYRKGGEK